MCVSIYFYNQEVPFKLEISFARESLAKFS